MKIYEKELLNRTRITHFGIGIPTAMSIQEQWNLTNSFKPTIHEHFLSVKYTFLIFNIIIIIILAIILQ